MNIDVRKVGDCLSVEIENAGATINLGLLEEDEVDKLANKLLDVVWDLTASRYLLRRICDEDV
jgi:hypothetical protein